MINIKACERCGGDLVREELLGEVDLVCLQCGHRRSAPSEPVYDIKRRRPIRLRKAA